MSKTGNIQMETTRNRGNVKEKQKPSNDIENAG